MAEIVVDGGRSSFHCGIFMARNGESRKVILECIPFKYPMPCGKVYTFLNMMDLPEEDLPCTCGNPKHWFVKYMEES